MNESETQAHFDMTFETFCNEVQTSTSYAFHTEELAELFYDGYTVNDAIEWAEWKIDELLFGDDNLGDL